MDHKITFFKVEPITFDGEPGARVTAWKNGAVLESIEGPPVALCEIIAESARACCGLGQHHAAGLWLAAGRRVAEMIN